MRTGVVLLNLGGPATPEDIRPFLVSLFSDREIIRLPGGPLLQPLFARLIARLRLRGVKENYAKIGGASPILRLTRAQADGLEKVLSERGHDVKVVIAMRYTKPRAEDAVIELARAGVERVVALTLYPQYSKATTGSSLSDLRRTLDEGGYPFPLTVVDRYGDHPGYLDAMAERVREVMREDDLVLFSAHSLPQRFIDEGDPYVEEIERTVEGIRARLPEGQPWRLSYQSRAGPVQWVGPDTEEVVAELAAEGVTEVTAVPVAFVSEHVETLYELDLLYGGQAKELGITGWRRAPALDDSPTFLGALADLVEEALR